MATSRTCKQRGCRFVWSCVNATTGAETPIGLVTGATLNSSEGDATNTGYLAGTPSEDQTAIVLVDDGNGNQVLPDESRFSLDGVVYDLCNSSSASCTDELVISADFCLVQDCEDSTSDNAAGQQKFACGGSYHIRLNRINNNNTLTNMYDAPAARLTSKNRTIAGGTSTDHTVEMTFTIEESTYDNCFH